MIVVGGGWWLSELWLFCWVGMLVWVCLGYGGVMLWGCAWWWVKVRVRVRVRARVRLGFRV